jgi:hypothetical protein
MKIKKTAPLPIRLELSDLTTRGQARVATSFFYPENQNEPVREVLVMPGEKEGRTASSIANHLRNAERMQLDLFQILKGNS